jgi:hypothetical protein
MRQLSHPYEYVGTLLLQHSMALQLLLNISLALTVMFFLTVGSLKADISNWTEQNFMAAGLSGVCCSQLLSG